MGTPALTPHGDPAWGDSLLPRSHMHFDATRKLAWAPKGTLIEVSNLLEYSDDSAVRTYVLHILRQAEFSALTAISTLSTLRGCSNFTIVPGGHFHPNFSISHQGGLNASRTRGEAAEQPSRHCAYFKTKPPPQNTTSFKHSPH
jgi:hypothetical protein